MDKKVRLPQGIKNYTMGSVASLFSGLLMYLSRMVFLKYMTVDYVGYSSLFEYTFLLVSALDFGVVTSLVSFMARALNTQNKEKMNGALRMSKRIYLSVSVLMLLFLFSVSFFYMRGKGLFLPSFIYFLGQSAQYYLGWRVLALNASGRNDVVSLFVHGGRALGSVLEIIVISITQNYVFYISVTAISVVFSYVLMYVSSKRFCPWIEKGKGILEEREGKHVIRTLPAMACHRFGSVFFRAYEVIAVNLIFGFGIGGKYSNLVLISSFFMTLFWIFQSSVTGIMGEYYVSEGRKETMGIYKKMSYINLAFSFVLSVVFLIIGKWLATVSFGAENVLGGYLPLFMAIELFLLSSRTTATVVRDALGDYKKDWWKPLLEALTTILLNILLASRFSYSSVALSISITILLISVPIDNYIVSSRLSGRRSSFFLIMVLLSMVLILLLLGVGIYMA